MAGQFVRRKSVECEEEQSSKHSSTSTSHIMEGNPGEFPLQEGLSDGEPRSIVERWLVDSSNTNSSPRRDSIPRKPLTSRLAARNGEEEANTVQESASNTSDIFRIDRRQRSATRRRARSVDDIPGVTSDSRPRLSRRRSKGCARRCGSIDSSAKLQPRRKSFPWNPIANTSKNVEDTGRDQERACSLQEIAVDSDGFRYDGRKGTSTRRERSSFGDAPINSVDSISLPVRRHSLKRTRKELHMLEISCSLGSRAVPNSRIGRCASSTDGRSSNMSPGRNSLPRKFIAVAHEPAKRCPVDPTEANVEQEFATNSDSFKCDRRKRNSTRRRARSFDGLPFMSSRSRSPSRRHSKRCTEPEKSLREVPLEQDDSLSRFIGRAMDPEKADASEENAFNTDSFRCDRRKRSITRSRAKSCDKLPVMTSNSRALPTRRHSFRLLRLPVIPSPSDDSSSTFICGHESIDSNDVHSRSIGVGIQSNDDAGGESLYEGTDLRRLASISTGVSYRSRNPLRRHSAARVQKSSQKDVTLQVPVENNETRGLYISLEMALICAILSFTIVFHSSCMLQGISYVCTYKILRTVGKWYNYFSSQPEAIESAPFRKKVLKQFQREMNKLLDGDVGRMAIVGYLFFTDAPAADGPTFSASFFRNMSSQANYSSLMQLEERKAK